MYAECPKKGKPATLCPNFTSAPLRASIIAYSWMVEVCCPLQIGCPKFFFFSFLCYLTAIVSIRIYRFNWYTNLDVPVYPAMTPAGNVLVKTWLATKQIGHCFMRNRLLLPSFFPAFFLFFLFLAPSIPLPPSFLLPVPPFLFLSIPLLLRMWAASLER